MYTYTYDSCDRISSVTHKLNSNAAVSLASYTYDDKGRIATKKLHGSSSNQLTKVEDATGNAAGFKNGASQDSEYTYDNNGNLTKDLNKNISNIQYNSLNLPSVVTFSNGNTITYLYAADGRKLHTVHVINGFSFTTDYSGM